MNDTPITLQQRGDAGQAYPVFADEQVAKPETEAKTAVERGAHRLVYLAIVFSTALGLTFASDGLVSYSYDLPQNEWTRRISHFAEEWHRAVENAGLTEVTDQIRGFVAALRGG